VPEETLTHAYTHTHTLARTQENGLNTIQVYVFWNYHEHTRGEVDFSSDPSHDLKAFVQKCAAHGLWVNLRIGPYVCSEWTWGGLPLWLQDIANMSVRTNNEPFKEEMGRWVKRVVEEVRPLFADKGGPILMYQLENEYVESRPMNRERGMETRLHMATE
jgi:beta-galactosidase GanA